MPRAFVGDVQGCIAELDELIDRLRGDCGPDVELWFVGDLVNRGPSSLAVLRRVRDLVESGRGRTVLGNHELHLLRVFWGQRDLGATDTFRDVLEAPDARDWMEWLRRRPLLERGVIDGQAFAMVHAAVHPDWELDPLERRTAAVAARLAAPDVRDARALVAADPQRDAERDLLGRVTACRSVTATGWSSAVPARPRDAWHARWRARGHRWGVVYGHWALQGLHVAAGLRGLDTGCVHHGRDHDGFLTAWSPECSPLPSGARPFDVPDERFVQVLAHRRYRGVEAAAARATNA